MNDTTEPNWERKTIEKLAYSALDEQRKTRRWGIFFKILTFLYLLFVALAAFGLFRHGSGVGIGKHTAVVELRGVISSDSEASADRVNDSLRAAFKDANTRDIIGFNMESVIEHFKDVQNQPYYVTLQKELAKKKKAK